MTEERQEELFSSDPEDREGVYDPQLSLPIPPVPEPQAVSAIVKRDGREEDFDKYKIADAIFNAAKTVGGQDRDLAESLASAVAIYLTKRLLGATPTVDQVHDAVERVLIHMGHARTALAYARYRDRHARIRRLREGDMRALISELEEARHKREALGGHSQGALLAVRTSGDRIVSWDRNRIVEALVRETDLERAIAEVVAHEVEQQIEAANLTTLTTSLVRELVDARLVEHGLLEHRERHRRLGVPLYDAERIIRGNTSDTLAQDPTITDQELAKAVKREYALAHVFSAPVTEAHLRGDIHIHHLDRVDRLGDVTVSLEHVAQHGIGARTTEQFEPPADNAQTLLAHMLKRTSQLQRFFAGTIQWTLPNLCFAPFLQGLNNEQIRQFASVVAYEFAYRALMQGDGAPGIYFSLCWNVPDAWRDRDAIGPNGEPTGKPYGDYEATAQQFAWALLDVLREGTMDGLAFPAPIPAIVIEDAFLKAPGHDTFLTHISQLASLRHNVHIQFDRGNTRTGMQYPTVPGTFSVQQITLNLPRLAFEAGKESGVKAGLDRLLKVIVQTHEEKNFFLTSLMDEQGQRPLASLTRSGFVEVDNGEYGLAVDGLYECVQILINTGLEKTEEAAELAERILAHLQHACAKENRRQGIQLRLMQNTDCAVSQRFANLDASAYPKTMGTTLDMTAEEQGIQYTPGVQVKSAAGISPIDLVQLEGRCHAHLDRAACSRVHLPLENISHEAITDFVTKAFRQTSSAGIRFV